MDRASKCDFCAEEFISRSELHEHMAGEHGKPGSTPKTSFKCSVCDRVFGYKNVLIDHMRTHTGERPFKCTVDECEMAFKQLTALKNHIKYKHSDERRFQCNFQACTYIAKTSTDLTSHKKGHSADRPFACSDCDYQTNRINDLNSHRMRHHSVGRDFKGSHPQCTTSFKTSGDLKSHFSYRHKEKNVECDHPGCGRNFATSTALNKHKMNSHSKKSLVCPDVDCGYRTNTKGKLARHMNIHDGGNEKISCSIEGCKYKGRNTRALGNHMRLHKTLLRCPESGCGHYAPTKEALKKHVKLHNSSGRPFQCPLCFKYYQTLKELQIHCFAHTNEKPFACGHCEYGASIRSAVKTHISSVHSNIRFPFIVHLLDERECLDCNVTFSTAEFLLHCERHVDPIVMEA